MYLVCCLPHELLCPLVPYCWHSDDPAHVFLAHLVTHGVRELPEGVVAEVTNGMAEHSQGGEALTIRRLHFRGPSNVLKNRSYRPCQIVIT